LACKVKALKADLKVWNEEVFSIVDRLKRPHLEELQDLRVVEEERASSIEERVRKAIAVSINSHGGGEVEAKI
jgi:hypothetical protein